MNKIVVIGSSNMDLVVNATKAPEGGETVIGTQFDTKFGGKGANQAFSVLRIGGDVTFVTKVGKDVFGTQITEHFKDAGMDISTVFTDDSTSTGVALITVDANAENRIVVVPGANATLTKEDIDKVRMHIEDCEYVIIQLEIPMVTVEYAINMAWTLGKKVVLNPAPACPLPEGLMSKVFLVTPNETEASLLTGIHVTNEEETAIAAADVLFEQGVQNVIITLGSKGALVCSKNEKQFVPAFSVKAIDTTAAGDAFNGAFTVALAEGKDMIEAARMACATSAIAVTRTGAQDSVPTREELDKFLSEH